MAVATELLAPKHLLVQQAAALTTITTPRFDMQGYSGCLFLCKMGAIDATGVVTVAIHQAATDIDGVEVVGSKITLADTDDNALLALSIFNPDDRYVQIQIARTVANSVIEYAVCMGYNASSLPVDLTGLVDYSSSVVRPAEV